MGFPGGSEGKASTCNAGNPSSIPGLGRSLGEGNSNPLQYSCLENPMDRGAWWATVHGVAKSRTRLSDITFFLSFLSCFWKFKVEDIATTFTKPSAHSMGGRSRRGSHRCPPGVAGNRGRMETTTCSKNIHQGFHSAAFV